MPNQYPVPNTLSPNLSPNLHPSSSVNYRHLIFAFLPPRPWLTVAHRRFLSPESTFVNFHSSPSNSWQGLIFGQRRVFLYPPYEMSMDPQGDPLGDQPQNDQPLHEASRAHDLPLWYDRQRREVMADGTSESAGEKREKRGRYFACTQEAGDLLFIPAHWDLGLVSTAESVGLSLSLGYDEALFDLLQSVV